MNEEKLFNIYLTELLEWNKKCNLTSITDPKEIEVKHFEDSLSILKAVELQNQSVVDIGSGAGFPGIPLKIARPNIKLTLIEATRKKTEFLKHLIEVLNLQDVKVIWGRAEKRNPKNIDIVVARAVAKLPKLVIIALPYLKKGGLFIAQKGPIVEDAKNEIREAGGRLKEIKQIELSNGHKRSLVIIEKI
ncbi:MAG: 16S rRNA (guanine(527)-N(7))-methyltransferase RsmG [Candidatus Saganbacteria bacterium]|nr:16S rRNA (guanine(527)-N(7))-methyltransferase RsmG [Candidatus Saganbacteria bacterium]